MNSKREIKKSMKIKFQSNAYQELCLGVKVRMFIMPLNKKANRSTSW